MIFLLEQTMRARKYFYVTCMSSFNKIQYASIKSIFFVTLIFLTYWWGLTFL